MNIKEISGGVTAAKGFKASGIHCGIRKNKEKLDLALILSDVQCSAAAVYTQNKVKGSPIIVTQKNIADGKARAVICNSGNANTCNSDGEEKAQMMCELAASALNIKASDMVVASTGVIGQKLPIQPIENGIPALVAELSENGSANAALAIMTTDLLVKEVAVSFEIDGVECRIGGIAKGSGMIHPNMATMLCFLTSDVNISSGMLQKALSTSVKDTFNMVSVDGDTSTNDMVTIMANGQAKNLVIDSDGENYNIFFAALNKMNNILCRKVAKDGEGASKLVECTVKGCDNIEGARNIAKSVVTSSLVKTAMFGADANWGRILCAVGYAQADFDINKVDVSLSSKEGIIEVCRNGSGIDFDEDLAKKILLEDEIFISINLNCGHLSATAFGCDLTYDYVKINGDYRT